MTQKKFGNPRKFRNFLLNPDMQLAFAINIIALSAFFVVAIGFVVYFQLGDFIQKVLTVADLDSTTLSQLRADWDATTYWLGLFLGSYVLITLVLCVIYTHRMIGPTIAFKRHIEELLSGRYNSRITLRDGDAFDDVAESLNDLAENLEKKFENLAQHEGPEKENIHESTG